MIDSLNAFEKVVMAAIDATLKEQNYTNIEKYFLENGASQVKITYTILESNDYPKTYKYKVGNKCFVLQFYDRNQNGHSIPKAIAVLSSVGGIGFNLQFDTQYVYCGTRTNLSDEIIKDVESANGDIGIIKKILNHIIIDPLNAFEKVVMATIDATLNEQNYTNIEKYFLENGKRQVKITHTILESNDYPKTYKYIVGNKCFILQFYDRTRNGDSILKAIAVLSSVGDIGFNLQFDTQYVYCGTHTNLSDEIIKDVESANGGIGIIKKILNYILWQ